MKAQVYNKIEGASIASTRLVNFINLITERLCSLRDYLPNAVDRRFVERQIERETIRRANYMRQLPASCHQYVQMERAIKNG